MKKIEDANRATVNTFLNIKREGSGFVILEIENSFAKLSVIVNADGLVKAVAQVTDADVDAPPRGAEEGC